MTKPLLRWLGRSVYGTFVPLSAPLASGSETYLTSLWNDAPFSVAALHTLIAFVVLCLPPFLIFKPKLLSHLSASDRERFQQKMLTSRIYPIRLLAYGVKGHALVAVFRNPEVRRQFFVSNEPGAKAV